MSDEFNDDARSSSDKQSPNSDEKKEQNAGPPQLLHLVKRIREGGQRFFGISSEELDKEQVNDDTAPPQPPDDSEDAALTDSDRARLLIGILSFFILPTLWFGPRLKYPFDAVTIMIAAVLSLIMASLAHQVPSRIFVVAFSLAAGLLMLMAAAMLLQVYPLET